MTFKEIMQQLGYDSENTEFIRSTTIHSGIPWFRFWDAEKRVSIVMNGFHYANRDKVTDFTRSSSPMVSKDHYDVCGNLIQGQKYTQHVLWSPIVTKKVNELYNSNTF